MKTSRKRDSLKVKKGLKKSATVLKFNKMRLSSLKLYLLKIYYFILFSIFVLFDSEPPFNYS